MTTTEQDKRLEEVGKCAYESIVEMVAALKCDYDRLAELRGERADLASEAEDDTNIERNQSRYALKEWDKENAEELAALEDLSPIARDDETSTAWQAMLNHFHLAIAKATNTANQPAP